jgi:hypothetical protein
MKIIVDSEELKQEIIKQSEYIHDFLINKNDVKNLGKDWLIGLDSDKAGILMHLYMTPQIIEVKSKINKNDKVILNCDESAFVNQENRRNCINKVVTIRDIFYDSNNNIDTFFVEENDYEWVPENIVRITKN